MNPWFAAFISSIITTGAFALLLVLCRQLLVTWVTKRVEHDFNVKLEEVRAEQRLKEELLKAELREKDNAIAVLRSGAVSAMASRQMAVDKRTIEAVDQLWSAVSALSGAKLVCTMASSFNFKAITKEDAKNPALRELFDTIDKSFDHTKSDTSGAQKARPYVSPMAWALYTAYSAILMQAVAQVKLVKSGMVTDKLINSDFVAKLIKAALPNQAAFVDKHGDSGNHLHLDELETALLAALRQMLAGEESDKATLQRAADILKLANELSEKRADTSTVGPSKASAVPTG